jgi:hypothetical protein
MREEHAYPAYPHLKNWNGDGAMRPDYHGGLTKRECYAMAALPLAHADYDLTVGRGPKKRSYVANAPRCGRE